LNRARAILRSIGLSAASETAHRRGVSIEICSAVRGPAMTVPLPSRHKNMLRHPSRASLRRPQCGSLQSGLNTRSSLRASACHHAELCKFNRVLRRLTGAKRLSPTTTELHRSL
jgi:hypothetical protein